jgi:hypothetical protein
MQFEPTSSKMTVLILNIIQGAIIIGALIFSVVILNLNIGKPQPPWNMFEILGLVVGGVTLVLSVVVPSLIRQSPIKTLPVDENEHKYFQFFQSSMIVKYALLEGGIMANLVMNISPSTTTLGMIGVLFLALICSVATTGQLEKYLLDAREEQQLNQFTNLNQ